MEFWQIFALAGLGFLILELFMPALFFLNFAIGAFVTAIIAVVTFKFNMLIFIFAVVSILSLLLFRPFLANNLKQNKNESTGIEGKYINKKAKVTETVTAQNGVITIYGERWEARSNNPEEVFEKDLEVKIIRNDGLVMYVENI